MASRNIRSLTLDPYTNVSNLYAVREDLKAYCLRDLHEVALSIETLELPDLEEVPSTPPNPAEFSPSADPLKMKIYAYQLALKEYHSKRILRQNQLRQLFGLIYSSFSNDVKLRVLAHPEYNSIESEYDGFKLWKLVVKVLTSGTPNESDPIRSYRVERNYHSCVMSPSEHITDFTRRFKDAVESIRNNGGDEAVPSGEKQAVQFIESLSHNFNEFKSVTMNAISNKTLAPKSIDDVLALATNYRPVMPQSYKSNHVSNSVMYTSDAKPHRPANPNRNRIHSRQQNRHQFPSDKSQRKSSPSRNTSKKGGLCHYCHSNEHAKDSCPKLLKKRSPIAHINTAFQESYLLPDDEDTKFNFSTVGHIEFVVSAVSPSKLSLNDIILDTGAETSIFGNKDFLTNLRKCKFPIYIRGVNSGSKLLKVNTVGTFRDIEVFYSRDSNVNIISFAHLNKSHPLSFNPVSNLFKSANDDMIFDFCNNLYIMRNHLNISTSSIATKKNLVREVQQRLGFTSERTLMDAIRMGSITHIPVTLKDVEETLSREGRHIATIMGKSQLSQSPHLPFIDVPKYQYKNITLHLDIMFVETQPYLISVSEIIDLTLINFLEDQTSKSGSTGARSYPNLKNHFFLQIDKYKKWGFSVNKVICDREGAFIKLIPDLDRLGIIIEPASGSSHPSGKIDRRIRSIKESVRCIIIALPFQLPMVLLKYAVMFAVTRFNLIRHNPGWADGASPRELLTGRKTEKQKRLPRLFW